MLPVISYSIHVEVKNTGLFIFILLPVLFICYYRIGNARKGKDNAPTNWPVMGMLPDLLLKSARILDYITEFVLQSGGTFLLKGPAFANMDMLITCDPANVNYVLTKNFSNFGKGPGFKEIFEDLGDGIFAAESKSWESQRRISKSFFSDPSFPEFVSTSTWRKIETELIPILDDVSEKRREVDLQDLFQRLAFDCSCIMLLGHDPNSFCKELPHLPYEKAFVDAEEAILYRHMLPNALWRMQKWLQIGREKKLSQAAELIHIFMSYCISLKQVDLADRCGKVEDFSMLTSCLKALAEKGDATNISEKVLKDLMLNLIFAGKDTIGASLTWFFWLLATNPAEEEKTRNEIEANSQDLGEWKFSNREVLNKLIYLHAALCETLRLFPPVPLQHKAPIKHDILPSGHQIKPNTRTILAFYSMGRMESIWGKDCLQFKPGRWISDTGHVKVEPSYKFTAFNAGPRSCLGKEMSFIQLKIVAAAMISRFRIEVAAGHPIQPSNSVILHMKHGLKVKVSKHE